MSNEGGSEKLPTDEASVTNLCWISWAEYEALEALADDSVAGPFKLLFNEKIIPSGGCVSPFSAAVARARARLSLKRDRIAFLNEPGRKVDRPEIIHREVTGPYLLRPACDDWGGPSIGAPGHGDL